MTGPQGQGWGTFHGDDPSVTARKDAWFAMMSICPSDIADSPAIAMRRMMALDASVPLLRVRPNSSPAVHAEKVLPRTSDRV